MASEALDSTGHYGRGRSVGHSNGGTPVRLRVAASIMNGDDHENDADYMGS